MSIRSIPSNQRTNERSQETNPAYLYVFNSGGTLYHLTNYSEDIEITSLPASLGSDPETFISGQIAHSAVTQEMGKFSPEVNISIGLNDNSVADELQQYFLVPQTDQVTITIIRVNDSAIVAGTSLDYTDDCFVVFHGEKSAIGIEGRALSFGANSFNRSEKRRFPRFFYQPTCNHNLGDAFCQVNLESANNKLVTTVGSIDRFKKSISITDTTINSNPITESTFQGGLLREMDGVGGNIVSVIGIDSVEDLGGGSGFRLRLTWLSSTLIAGTNTDLEIIRSCNKTSDDCANKHSNLANFGGMPYIPIVNPVTEGIRT